jgi:hypothetical protein
VPELAQKRSSNEPSGSPTAISGVVRLRLRIASRTFIQQFELVPIEHIYEPMGIATNRWRYAGSSRPLGRSALYSEIPCRRFLANNLPVRRR